MTVLQVVDGLYLMLLPSAVCFSFKILKKKHHTAKILCCHCLLVLVFSLTVLFPAVMLFVEQQRVLNVATVC